MRRIVPSGSRSRGWRRTRRDCGCDTNATQAQDALSTLHVGGFRDVDHDASLPRMGRVALDRASCHGAEGRRKSEGPLSSTFYECVPHGLKNGRRYSHSRARPTTRRMGRPASGSPPAPSLPRLCFVLTAQCTRRLLRTYDSLLRCIHYVDLCETSVSKDLRQWQ